MVGLLAASNQQVLCLQHQLAALTAQSFVNHPGTLAPWPPEHRLVISS